MALYRRPSTVLTTEEEKLIFAPAGHHPHGQAPQFTLSQLHRKDLDPTSPIPQFNAWFSLAQRTPSISQPEACTLSTAHLPSGRVSSRIVYLKELDPHGFVMYTNLGTSRKAHDLQTNPHASLVFYWPPLQRQVRVEGITETNSREESQTYFDTRVRGSRIGAWASRQSAVLKPQPSAKQSAPESGSEALVNGTDATTNPEYEDDGRAQLEGWVKEVEERFKGQDKIPVPDFWGGLRLVPQRVEFWQGRESRLHDRFVYEWEEGEDGKEGKWRLERLSP
ncbi:pyridoxamine 5'-phosphate oxidase domain-containing protein [Trichoderma breve]|uniref:pyridoxal 5'-phosphate synthase n=1 Tax=Trichoderma breve TaxID=2034170 RepID=A0A9W9EDJ1_9HYPO|nr:pyridoxamine 5'-phosphate oxidase domain-containing protein [Trichoderma breve]KAJ4864731.1 pyridoxamine 5'-phosphate oxidase domain-containing protein [Trichoderma breve]